MYAQSSSSQKRPGAQKALIDSFSWGPGARRPHRCRRAADEAALHLLARVPELGIQAHAVEVARQRADVRRDRHAVVVEHDHDRRAQAAGLMDGLERDPAGHGAVADHGDHLALVEVAHVAHALLDAHGVAHRGGGVPRAHDVVRRFRDRAEGREPSVLADRGQLVTAAGEHLVGVGLVADVPQDLVARRLEQRMQRHRQLARPQVGAEVPADLPHGVDDVLAHLLRHLRQLLLGEGVQIAG